MIQAIMICAVLAMHDGDSGRGDGVAVRLSGIDAPETAPFTRCRQRPTEWACLSYNRRWGAAATARARRLAADGARCTVLDTDQYRRRVVRCEVQGRDMGAILVREGLAISASGYGDPYRTEEQAAWADDRGVWDRSP